MTMLLDKLFGTYLGIEFKEGEVVVAYLKNNLSGITLISSATFTLGDNDAVINEIREFISKHAMEVNRVFVSVPDKWAIIKFTSIPSVKGKGKGALANLMRFEIERHIPFEIDEVAYDFMVMDERDRVYSVVFVAVRKEKIDYVKDFLEKLTLHPHAITITSFAILNTVELSGVQAGGWQDIIGIVRRSNILGRYGETNIFLYIDKMYADLAIIKDGLCIQLRSFVLHEDWSLDEFLNDVVTYLTEMQSRHSMERFNKLILGGDKTLANNLMDKFQEKIRANVINTNELSRFTGDLKGIEVNGLAPSIGACFTGLGIGTYRANLLPHKMEYEIKKIAPFATKVFLILILVLIIGIFTTEAMKQKSLLMKMEAAIKKNEPEVKILEKLSSEIDVLRKRSNFLHNVKENEITLEVLAELSRIIPKDSWITNLHYKGFSIKNKKKSGGELIISGYAASSSILVPLLEDSPYFEKVEFVGPIKKTRQKEQFKLSARVVRPTDENTSGE
jgi:Tfp pilus assembly protein PilN